MGKKIEKGIRNTGRLRGGHREGNILVKIWGKDEEAKLWKYLVRNIPVEVSESAKALIQEWVRLASSCLTKGVWPWQSSAYS